MTMKKRRQSKRKNAITLSSLLRDASPHSRVPGWDELAPVGREVAGYDADEGPLTQKQLRAIKKLVPQGRFVSTRSLLSETKSRRR